MDKEIQKIVESFGATLYDTELESVDESHIFRVLIQKEGGVDLDLCSSISHVMSPYLDTNPPVKGKYFLEVSSAGIERNLRRLDLFEKSIGELVKIKLKGGEKLSGKITSVSGDKITVECDEGSKEFLFGNVTKAKTYFEW